MICLDRYTSDILSLAMYLIIDHSVVVGISNGMLFNNHFTENAKMNSHIMASQPNPP